MQKITGKSHAVASHLHMPNTFSFVYNTYWVRPGEQVPREIDDRYVGIFCPTSNTKYE